MLRKRSLLIAVGIVSILIIAATPLAKKTEVYFSFRDDEVTIHPGEVGVYRWGWRNCTYGLSLDWINATSQHYVVRSGGEVIAEISQEEAAKPSHWGDPFVIDYIFDGKPIREWCAWPATNAYRVWWQHSELRFKHPGVYELEVFMETTEPLIDGFAYITPPLDIYDAQVFFNKTIVVTVEE